MRRIEREILVSEQNVEKALERGIEFLRANQLPYGEFPTYMSASNEMTEVVFDSSPFVTTLVVHALSYLDRARVSDMVEPALDFLASEMEFGGVWRYYSSRQFKHCRIPPDLDDTACATYELRRAGRAVTDNDWIFRYCRDPEGRYVTWVMRNPGGAFSPRFWLTRLIGDFQAERARRRAPIPKVVTDRRLIDTPHDRVTWDNVDPVVNANVMLLFGDRPDTEEARKFVIEQVLGFADKGFSKYYHDALMLYYMVARACRQSAPSLASVAQPVADDICRRQEGDGAFGSPLKTALATSALQTFSPGCGSVAQAVSALVRMQQDDGSWQRNTFYAGPGEFWGSEVLTTAICIEVLARHLTKD